MVKIECEMSYKTILIWKSYKIEKNNKKEEGIT